MLLWQHVDIVTDNDTRSTVMAPVWRNKHGKIMREPFEGNTAKVTLCL